MAATLGVYLALAGATWFYLRYRYPVSTFWPMQVFEAGWLLAPVRRSSSRAPSGWSAATPPAPEPR